MLTITIKPESYFTIGDNITIHNRDKRKVRVSIDAPRDLKILRGELRTEQDAQQDAGQGCPHGGDEPAPLAVIAKCEVCGKGLTVDDEFYFDDDGVRWCQSHDSDAAVKEQTV